MGTRYEVAIIGAGPAGVAAAVQLQRFGINPLLFEKTRIGGLLNNAYLVENYPGFPNGISGINLVKKLKQHLKKWHLKIVKERVVKISREKSDFIVQTSRKYRAQIVVVASGTEPKLPKKDITGFQKKIFFEVYPIRNTKNKRIVIVGAGDAAFDYALNLSRYNKVTIFNRKNEIKGLDLLFKRMKKINGKGKIDYFKNTKIHSIKRLNNYLITEIVKNGKRRNYIKCDYILFAIGREPAIDFLTSSVRHKFPEGDNKRIYFIGDVRHGNLRQTGIAIGDGVLAAIKVNQYLEDVK